MRISFLAFLFFLLTACSSTREAVDHSLEIVEIMPRYMEAESFKRISEYMTGKENPGRRVILRTDDRQRDGYYFVLILNKNVRSLPPDAYIIAEFYTSQSLGLQSQRFDLPFLLPNTKEIFVGLTGKYWLKEGDMPAAWRFTIKNSQDKVLTQAQSYLWSL